MKNKNSKYLVIGSLSLIVLTLITALIFNKINNYTVDGHEFKREYEALNKEVDEDGNKKYYQLSIDKDAPVTYLSYEELEEFLNNGTGVLYFGRPGCPWCRLLVPGLFDFANENEIKIKYYNIEKDRKDNNANYKEILSKLDAYLPNDNITQKEGEEGYNPSLKRVILPHLFFLNKGQVMNNALLYEHDLLKEKDFDGIVKLLNSLYAYTCLPDEPC